MGLKLDFDFFFLVIEFLKVLVLLPKSVIEILIAAGCRPCICNDRVREILVHGDYE